MNSNQKKTKNQNFLSDMTEKLLKVSASLLNLLPLRFCSYQFSKIVNCKCSKIKNGLIRLFIYFYHIDLSECRRQSLDLYESFNDFFTRELAPGTRSKMVNTNQIVSPADGFISELGTIIRDQILQIKNCHYSVSSLLGNIDDAKVFENGKFFTVYLAPHNYHRVHTPMDARLEKMIYIPGQLFSVNAYSVKHAPQLFTRNERLVCLFSTSIGQMAVILVGAFLVGGISVCWHGTVNINHPRQIQVWNYKDHPIILKQHQELGQFQYGSTVILLFPKETMQWLDHLEPKQMIKVGDVIGDLIGHHRQPNFL